MRVDITQKGLGGVKMSKSLHGFDNNTRRVNPLTLVEVIIILVCAVLIVTMLSCYFLFSKAGSTPKLFGQIVYVTNANNMEPDIPSGSAVFASDENLDLVQKGNAVLFRVDDGSGNSVTGILRVLEIAYDDSGSLYYTLGTLDENGVASPDTIRVSQEQIIAKCLTYDTTLGAIIGFTTSTMGLLTVVVIPCLLLIVFQVVRIIRIKSEDDEDDDDYYEDIDDEEVYHQQKPVRAVETSIPTREPEPVHAAIKEPIRTPVRESVREPVRTSVREPVRTSAREPVREPLRMSAEPARTNSSEVEELLNSAAARRRAYSETIPAAAATAYGISSAKKSTEEAVPIKVPEVTHSAYESVPNIVKREEPTVEVAEPKKLFVDENGTAKYRKNLPPTSNAEEFRRSVSGNSEAADEIPSFRKRPAANSYKPDIYNLGEIRHTEETPQPKIERPSRDIPKLREPFENDEASPLRMYYTKDVGAETLKPPAVEKPVDVTIPAEAALPTETIAPPPKKSTNKTVDELMRMIDEA